MSYNWRLPNPEYGCMPNFLREIKTHIYVPRKASSQRSEIGRLECFFNHFVTAFDASIAKICFALPLISKLLYFFLVYDQIFWNVPDSNFSSKFLKIASFS